MGEFCFDCYKKYCNPNAKKEEYILDKKPDLCEGCGVYKIGTVVKAKQTYFLSKLFHKFYKR